MNKPLVIFHNNCQDGFAAAFAAWLKLGDDAEYLPMQYGKDDVFKIPPWTARDVYILDFSLPRDYMDKIFSEAKRVVWLDHHKTAFEMWCGKALDKFEPTPGTRYGYCNYILLDNNKSGAVLAWEFFHPRRQVTNNQERRPWAIRFNGYGNDVTATPSFMEDETLYTKKDAEETARRLNSSALTAGDTPSEGHSLIYEAMLAPPGYGEEFSETPLFVRHIDDHDRWQFQITRTKEFNKALWSYTPWSFTDWKARFIVDGDLSEQYVHGVMYPRLYTEGAAILRAHNQNVQSVVKGGARKCLIKCRDNIAVIPGTPFANSLPGPCLLPGLAANCPPHLASDVGHELAVQSGTFGLLWCMKKDGLIANCSLRSNGNYDVSAIAKAFGGGGHKNAAGFEVDVQTLLEWLK